MGLIPDELRAQAERFPDRLALQVDGDGRMTFAEWDAWSNAVAHHLVAADVARGDRVALLLPNDAGLRYQVAYFGVQKAGAIAVPINPRYAPRELAHILDNSGARAVITTDGERSRVDGQVPLVVADERWDEWVHGDEADDSPIQVPLDPGDVADILYTSGTTGLPKGVTATHENSTASRMKPLDDGGKLLHAVPLPTFVGTYGAVLMCLRTAITSILLPSFDTARFAALVAEERPGWVLAVPAHLLLLLESGALDDVDTTCVSVLMYGSAPMPAHAVERLAEVFPNAAQVRAYGLTEGGGSVVSMPPGESLKRPGSVGRPMRGVELRVVDESGSPRANGAVGEVLLKITAGRRSYFNDPEASARTWQDGWVHTGDLGYVDDDGFLYLVDRKKDMIVRGGYNVYSIEVESALYEHPDVVEVAVVGIPHDVLGQDVAAIVRLREGADALTLDAVRAFLSERLADYKQPRRLVIRDEPLPRSGMAKVDKKALLAELT